VRILVASHDDAWATALQDRLAAAGPRPERARTWAETLARVVVGGIVVVDATLPGADGALLADVARAAGADTTVRTLRGALPPLLASATEADIASLAGTTAPARIDDHEQRLLGHFGLGPEPLERLAAVARTSDPVVLEGERGTGKEWIARLVHRLTRLPGPFVRVAADEDVALHGAVPGTLYLDRAHVVPLERLDERVLFARATGWKLVAGTRDLPPGRFGAWTVVALRPLREHPEDVRPLARLYLEGWSERLSLPPRRVHHTLWPVLERHPWPGNHRELETFVVQAATSTRTAVISRSSLPRSVIARLDPVARETQEARALEEMVEERLRAVVERYEALPHRPTLHRLVVDATERALLRLALHRTDGNRKAAARLLGVARNTLKARMKALDVAETTPREEE